MNILVTGGSGFLGNNLVSYFRGLNEVDTLGRGEKNSIKCDLSKEQPTLNKKYDCVIHCAGKAHMTPKTEKESKAFFEVNVIGTQKLLLGLEKTKVPPGMFVFISSVSVYGIEKGLKVDETFELKGNTPYGKSKIEAEKCIIDWCEHRGINYLILRLPLIIGRNAPGNLLKMINGIKTGKYLRIAGGRARKSMVFVDDIGAVIMRNLEKKGIYNLTDGYDPSFKQIEDLIAVQLGKKPPRNIPLNLAKVLGLFGDLYGKFPINSSSILKITNDLTFSSEKASEELEWKPRRVVDNFQV